MIAEYLPIHLLDLETQFVTSAIAVYSSVSDEYVAGVSCQWRELSRVVKG